MARAVEPRSCGARCRAIIPQRNAVRSVVDASEGESPSTAVCPKEANMQINPYINFNGQCEAAFKFYEKVLGGKIVGTMTFGGSPMADQAPAGWQEKIMHAALKVDDSLLMGSDAPDRYVPMQGSYVSIGVKDPAEAERIFHALAENGQVQMPIQETFWAPRFGMLVDRFGISWMVNCEPAS
jgi:PhnB protein